MSASVHNPCPMGIEMVLIDTLMCPVIDSETLALKLYHHPEIAVVRFKFLHRSGQSKAGQETFFDPHHGCNVTTVEVEVPTLTMSRDSYFNQVAQQMFRQALGHVEYQGQCQIH